MLTRTLQVNVPQAVAVMILVDQGEIAVSFVPDVLTRDQITDVLTATLKAMTAPEEGSDVHPQPEPAESI
jgi:hypothetical protein